MTLCPSTSSKCHAFLTHQTATNFLTIEPNTFNQAKHYVEWRDAMSCELDASLTVIGGDVRMIGDPPTVMLFTSVAISSHG